MRLPPFVVSALGLTAVVFAAGLTAIPQQPAFRSGIDLVNLGVAVLDKGGVAVSGLTQDDFVVYEEGKRQEVRYFAAEGAEAEAMPLHIGLVFDTSGSMSSDMYLARGCRLSRCHLRAVRPSGS